MPVDCEVFIIKSLDPNDLSKMTITCVGTCTLFSVFYGKYTMYSLVFHQETIIGNLRFPPDFLHTVLAGQVALKPIYLEGVDE